MTTPQDLRTAEEIAAWVNDRALMSGGPVPERDIRERFRMSHQRWARVAALLPIAGLESDQDGGRWAPRRTT